MAQRTAEPVETPDDERVAVTELLQRQGQTEPFGRSTRGDVAMDPLAAGLLEGIELEGEGVFPAEMRA